MLDKLILFVVHWTIIYFIVYCLIMYFISKINQKNDDSDNKRNNDININNNTRLLDFIWACKYDYLKHKMLIFLALVITAVVLKVLF